jgi:hypothetical protein
VGKNLHNRQRHMSSHRQKLKLLLVCGALFFTAVAALAQNARCSSPEYHQFDFWVGDWDGFNADTGAKEAHLLVDRILDGCVVREQYDGDDGHRGQSFSIYDATRKLWHQTWVTNRGELLTIEGKLEGNTMVLTGRDIDASGKKRWIRGEWKPVGDGVRETAFTSQDSGKTWKPWFDLIFRPAKPRDASTAPGH